MGMDEVLIGRISDYLTSNKESIMKIAKKKGVAPLAIKNQVDSSIQLFGRELSQNLKKPLYDRAQAVFDGPKLVDPLAFAYESMVSGVSHVDLYLANNPFILIFSEIFDGTNVNVIGSRPNSLSDLVVERSFTFLSDPFSHLDTNLQRKIATFNAEICSPIHYTPLGIIDGMQDISDIIRSNAQNPLSFGPQVVSVQLSHYSDFVDQIKSVMEFIPYGNPRDNALVTQMTPLEKSVYEQFKTSLVSLKSAGASFIFYDAKGEYVETKKIEDVSNAVLEVHFGLDTKYAVPQVLAVLPENITGKKIIEGKDSNPDLDRKIKSLQHALDSMPHSPLMVLVGDNLINDQMDFARHQLYRPLNSYLGVQSSVGYVPVNLRSAQPEELSAKLKERGLVQRMSLESGNHATLIISHPELWSSYLRDHNKGQPQVRLVSQSINQRITDPERVQYGVLIVDDRPESIGTKTGLQTNYLKDTDYKNAVKMSIETVIDQTKPGELALTRIEKGGIDLVIVDLDMPGMNGLELIEKIETMSNPPATIILTGRAEEYRIKLSQGLRFYVEKSADPTTLPLLYTQCKTALERRTFR